MNLDEKALLAKGFVRQPDGSWAKRPVPVHPLEGAVRKPDSTPALDRGSSPCQGRQGRVVVSLIGLRKRLLDSDNFCGGCKDLRDAIALWLQVDDRDSERLTWEYAQLRTTGPEGVIVMISTA